MSGDVGKGDGNSGPQAPSGETIVSRAPEVELVPTSSGDGRLAPLPLISTSDPYVAGVEAVKAYLVGQTSKRSRETAADALRRIVRLVTGGRSSDLGIVPWPTWGFREVTLVRTGLSEMSIAGVIAPGTANLTLSHLRGLIRTMYGLGLITPAQHELSHSNAMKNIRGSRSTRGRAITAEEERALREASRGLSGYKPQLFDAIMALAIGVGARRDEIAGLPLTALEPGVVTIIGKGNKDRPVPIMDQVQVSLDTWFVERDRLKPKEPNVFCSPKYPSKGLSRWALWALVRDVAHTAFGGTNECGEKCPCAKIVTGPHDFRRTFATRMLDAGVDIRQLQVLMGHESSDTTSKYDKRDHKELFDRVRKMRILNT